MGLFGFSKSVGIGLFDNDDEAAEKIKKHVEDNNPGVSDLGVTYGDNIADVCGDCDSAEAFEKVVLMVGNVKGVEDVYSYNLKVKDDSAGLEGATDANDTEKQQVPSSTSNVQFYTIESGDTLGKIAKEFYGNAGKYPVIFEANREVIQDPDKIYPGQKIRIPALED